MTYLENAMPDDPMTRPLVGGDFMEAADLASVFVDCWDDHVAQHHAIQRDPELKELADAATEAMADLYHAAAAHSQKEPA